MGQNYRFDVSKVALLYVEGGKPVFDLNNREKEWTLSKPTA